MRLPSETLIAREKVEKYLLQWRPEGDKSAFLALAGYTSMSVDALMTDLRSQLLPLEAEIIEQSNYGPKYRIRGTLMGPNGRTLRVVSIWITEEATGETRFITLYPDKP